MKLKHNLKLYKFQVEGVNFIEKNNGNVIIADEMGLGKSIEALVYLYNNPDLRPAIIVCPTSLKYNWYKEAKKWLDNTENIIIIDKKIKYRLDNYTTIIINYELISKYIKYLKKLQFEVMILDESHYVKNILALRTKYIISLSKGIPHKLLLSGTPMTNSISDIWTQLNIINPNEYNDYTGFVNRYSNIKTSYGITRYIGVKNEKELHSKLNKVMINRKKSEVLVQLPLKRRMYLPLPIVNRKEYNNLSVQTVDNIKERKEQNMSSQKLRIYALSRFELLKQAAIRGKLPYIIEWINTFLYATDEKLVIFASHNNIINILYNKYRNIAVKYHGLDKIEDRNKSVVSFNKNPKIRLFIGSIHTASLGITLASASIAIIIELGWTPSTMIQSEDRLHRIGQKHNVDIYYLLAKDTIDEKIASILEEKSECIGSVMDGAKKNNYKLLDKLIDQI